MPDGFRRWLSEKVTLCDTLVDRIVSEAIEPIGAVAEPYALWAIRREPGLREPFQHPAVVYTDDLEPFTRLKLHILNLGHTWLAQQWSATGRPADETVRAILADPPLREGLLSLYSDEVIPGFAARGMGAEATAYVAQTVERFDNPFLDHRLADIFQNHRLKIERRVTAFRDWVAAPDPALPLPRLAQLSQA
jgi:tagaturonate reductase